jgi:hypothetical protein
MRPLIFVWDDCGRVHFGNEFSSIFGCAPPLPLLALVPRVSGVQNQLLVLQDLLLHFLCLDDFEMQ